MTSWPPWSRAGTGSAGVARAPHQTGSLGGVPDLEPSIGQLLAQPVSALEVALGSRLFALGEEALGLGVRRIHRREERFEPEQREHVFECGPRTRKLAA